MDLEEQKEIIPFGNKSAMNLSFSPGLRPSASSQVFKLTHPHMLSPPRASHFPVSDLSDWVKQDPRGAKPPPLSGPREKEPWLGGAISRIL